MDFCDKNMSKILKQNNIQLKLKADESAIVKVDDCRPVALEDLRYDEFGNFSISTAFEPKYSVVQRDKDANTIEIVVEMDLINSIYTSKVKRDAEGYWFLTVKGEKNVPEPKHGETNRERGTFEVKINLLNLDKPTIRRDPEKGTKDGVVTCYFEVNHDPNSIEIE